MSDISTLAKKFKRALRNETGTSFSLDELRALAEVDIGTNEDRALSEATHYLHVYAQDGPAELWKRSKHRKWRNTGVTATYRPIVAEVTP